MKSIERHEVRQAQLALLLAILLQVTLNHTLVLGPKFAIAGLELALVIGIGITAPRRVKSERLHRAVSLLLIFIISLVNIASIALVCYALIHGSSLPGKELLLSAVAIFLTNVIIFAIWYWELDSPGLTGIEGQSGNNHFLFPNNSVDKAWNPTFPDYLYVSLTNATAFSPTDTMPLTHSAKTLMGIQSMASLITVALVASRAISILA